MCFLRNEDIITPLYLTINERVRQFGGDPSYSNFLMYLGLGLLPLQKGVKFAERTDDFIRFPRRISDHEIVKDFKNVEDFCKYLFPHMENTKDIPEGIVLTPKNENMRLINEQCLRRFKPEERTIKLYSKDSTYVPEENKMFRQETLNNHNPGSLPPHKLEVKPGCSMMLLRNVSLPQGLANGTRLRLLSVSKNKKVMMVEVLTGPRANPSYSLEERTFALPADFPCINSTDKSIRMTRRQFPVRLTYCMSINKAQGKHFVC